MNQILLLQIALVTGASMLALLAILAPQKRWKKTAALVMFLIVTGTGYAAYVQLLGLPKPVEFSALSLSGKEDKTIVIASKSIENVAIYLWVNAEETGEPVSYKLPWSLETAKKLRKAEQQAESNGAQVKISKLKGKGSGSDSQWVFEVEAPPPLPPKQI